MNLEIGSATDVGRTRTANEDCFFLDEDARVFAVADGMGGHRAGDVASSTAVAVVESHLGDGESLVDAIVAANDEVFTMAQANPELRGMGTTVTAAQFDEERVMIAQVGDSRAYLWRDGELTQVTEDHSLVEELVRDGRLTHDEAAVHPQRNIVTRALGVDEDVDVDTYNIDLRPDDRLVLCSDGLTSMVRDDDIASVLRASGAAQETAESLVEAANRAGGEDNITVVVVDVLGGKAKARTKAMKASQQVKPSPSEATGEWAQADVAAVTRTEPVAPAATPPPRAARWGRALLWVVPVLLVLGVAFFTLQWWATRTYHIAPEREGASAPIALYRGAEGGFLFWDPERVDRSAVRWGDLTEGKQEEIGTAKEFSSKRRAQAYLDELAQSTTTTTPSTTSTTTTTTLPAGGAPTPAVGAPVLN